jgi:hypothetical protein
VLPALVQSAFGPVDNTLIDLGQIGYALASDVTAGDASGVFSTLAAAPGDLLYAFLFQSGLPTTTAFADAIGSGHHPARRFRRFKRIPRTIQRPGRHRPGCAREAIA